MCRLAVLSLSTLTGPHLHMNSHHLSDSILASENSHFTFFKVTFCLATEKQCQCIGQLATLENKQMIVYGSKNNGDFPDPRLSESKLNTCVVVSERGMGPVKGSEQ